MLRQARHERKSPIGAWIQLCALVLVVAVPLVINPFGPDAYAGVKVQVLYGLAALLLLAWVAAAALRVSPAWRLTLPELAVWGFWLAVLLSSTVTANLRLTIFGSPGRHEGVLAVTTYVTLFFAGAQFFGTASGIRRLAVVAGIGAAIVIAYGFVQMVLPPWFEGEALIRSWYGATGLPRIISTLGSPIVFGGYLVVMVPLALALALSPPLPSGGEGRVRGYVRAAWFALAIAGSAAAVATYTRAAWLGLASAVGVFFLLAGREVWRHHRRALVAGGAALAAAVLVLLPALAGSAPVAQRAASTLTVQSGSGAQRVYIWRQTIGLIGQRPWLGWGLETLREVFPYDRASLERYFGRRPVIIDKAHNDVLQVAVSVGLPGAAAYGAIWILLLLAAYRVWRRAAGPARVLAAGLAAAFVGYLIQAQFSFSTVALAPLIWLLAGALAGWEASARG